MSRATERRLAQRMPKTYAHMQETGWVVIGKAQNGHTIVSHEEAGRAQIPFSSSDARCDMNTRTRLRRREAAAAERRAG